MACSWSARVAEYRRIEVVLRRERVDLLLAHRPRRNLHLDQVGLGADEVNVAAVLGLVQHLFVDPLGLYRLKR